MAFLLHISPSSQMYLDCVAGYKEKSSRLFESLVYFVEKLSLGSLKEAANQFPGSADATVFTPRELDDYDR